MHLIRQGFDGLDISYPLTVSEDVAEKLRAAQERAQNDPAGVGNFMHNCVMFSVAATGAPGGYRYRADSGRSLPVGTIWFFKHPNGKGDKWGVRVSCKALSLAVDGLSKMRAEIETYLERLGLDYVPGSESIGRVDVAFDFFVPDLELDRSHFVAHSRATLSEISDGLVQIVGRSGRVETVTIGKTPGRQVVLYDKRAEVTANHKPFWWLIWNAALKEQGLPPLNPKVRAESAVWRVEIRAHKKHLKDKWGITTWGHLREGLPGILSKALDEVRFCQPTADTNRARWPEHPVWGLVRSALSVDMSDLSSMVDPAEIEALHIAERDEMLRGQIAGCLLSRAALHDLPNDKIKDRVPAWALQIIQDWERNPQRMAEKLAQARVKYGRVTE